MHKNWDFATEEQRARIEQIKANTDRLKSGGNDDGEDGVVIVNDAPTGEDIGHCGDRSIWRYSTTGKLSTSS